MYLINAVDGGADMARTLRTKTLLNGAIFAVLFIGFVVLLMLADGYRADASGVMVKEDYIYWNNLWRMWWTVPMLLIGVVAVLYGIIRSALDSKFRTGIWYSGIGTVLVVMVLFFLAGYESTAYYPSLLDAQSSLTIANSSSSHFTLTVMSWVSLLVPFVIAYIWVVWRKMTRPASPTAN